MQNNAEFNLPPNVLARLIKFIISTKQVASCHFYVPTQNIESLHKETQEAVPLNSSYCSINNTIVALATLIAAQNITVDNYDPKGDEFIEKAEIFFYDKIIGGSGDFMTMVLVNVRSRLSHFGSVLCTGSSLLRESFTPQELLQMEPAPKALATIATSIHRTVISTDERHINQHFGALNRRPGSYIKPLLRYLKKRRFALISNNSRFDFHKLDFGASTLILRPASCGFPSLF
ncbi:hypothetical protein BX070DRAFT_235504 [Coemansia spiralis]|nr:hypothetical protein BX070DRAFT_235504 [Coemansia spiralis]